MKEFIVKTNGNYLFSYIVGVLIALVMYIGFPMLAINYYQTNHDQLLALCILMVLSYFLASVMMFHGVKEITKAISFNESGIVLWGMFKKASFPKEEVTYEIYHFIGGRHAISQQAVFIKAGDELVHFKEKEVINYTKAIEYLRKKCKEEKIRT